MTHHMAPSSQQMLAKDATVEMRAEPQPWRVALVKKGVSKERPSNLFQRLLQ